MVDIEKYKNDGWGLSKECFLEIEGYLKDIPDPIIVEFGSGISTKFFQDFLFEYNKNGKIYSFDNDKLYASEISKIKKIVECTDDDFDEMFKKKSYDFSKMKYRTVSPHTRQKNCFYDINDDEIPNYIDLVIVDGPHGNGRSISFLHIKNKMKKGGYVVIDDYNHYDFVERLLMIFPNAELISTKETGNINKWELGGNYKIFKI